MKKPFLRKIDLGLDSSGRKCVINHRTQAMLEVAEGRLDRKLGIIQGSFMKGIAAAESEHTHDKAGVVDLRTTGLTPAQVKETVKALRKVGFAAFHRTKAQGFTEDHIHAVAIGDPGLHKQAADQVVAFLKVKSGLDGATAGNPSPKKVKSFPL
jgi:hypothetical protein